jgi:hypothetical protein
VPASLSGKGEVCIGDLFNFDLKDVGAAVPTINTSTATLDIWALANRGRDVYWW